MPQVSNYNRTFDALLELDDGANGAQTSTFTGQVSSSDAVVDLGTGVTKGELVLQISAIDTTTGDESYRFVLQGGDATDFSTGNEDELASMVLGGATAKEGDQADAAPLQVELPFCSAKGQATYRYVRLRCVVGGTSPSITVGRAFLTKS